MQWMFSSSAGILFFDAADGKRFLGDSEELGKKLSAVSFQLSAERLISFLLKPAALFQRGRRRNRNAPRAGARVGTRGGNRK
jgi:hypothetical protein